MDDQILDLLRAMHEKLDRILLALGSNDTPSPPEGSSRDESRC